MVTRPYLTELETMTVELEASEHRREKVLVYMSQAPFMCFMKNSRTGQYEFMNSKGLALLGRTEDEVVGKTDLELLPIRLAKISISNDLQLLKTRTPIIGLESRCYKDRTALYLVSKFLVKNGEESIGGIALEVPENFKLEALQK